MAENRPANGSRLTDDWRPSADLVAQCLELGGDRRQLDWEAGKFRDYWQAATRNARKRDWPAAFRVWWRSSLDRRLRQHPALAFPAQAFPAEALPPRRSANPYDFGPGIVPAFLEG